MKIDTKEKPKSKGPVEFLSPDTQAKMVELDQTGEAEQEWGIPVAFLNWREEGKGEKKKKFHRLNYSGKQIARTVDERDILLAAVKSALESDDPEEMKKILLDAEESVIWSFIERGHYCDLKTDSEARRVLDKYGVSVGEEES